MTTKARQLAELIANSLVDSDEISTGAVTTSKLASTLDFSSKTMVMADNQLSGDKIHGGTVSAFASTGIDDNASATAVTILSDGTVGIGTDIDRGGILNVDGTTKGIVVRTSSSSAMELIHADNGAGIGPYLYLNRPSSGPAANDQIGRIVIQGKNSADEVIDYVRLVNQIISPTNGGEQGRFAINTMTNGTMYSRLNIVNGESVFNDESIDVDFRVESNNNANMLFVDAGNDRISVGSGSTYSMFNVISSNDNTSDWWTNTVATQYIQNTVGHPVLKMNNNNSNRSAYLVYNGNGSAQGFHIFDRQNEQSRISAYTSSVVINEAGTDVDFRVESDNNINALFVRGSDGNVGIGTDSPGARLHAYTTGYPVAKFERYGSSAATRGSTQLGHSSLGYSGGTGADTYIVAEHGFGVAVNAGTHALVITDGGNVGIGVSPSSGIQLKVGNNANNSAVSRITNGTVSVDLTASSSGLAFLEVGTNHPLVFATNASQRMRIDTSGHLLVGKTATGIGTVGAELKATGELLATVNNDACAFLNRKSSDGAIINFRKDGTTVGSIQTRGSAVSTFVLDPRTNGVGITGTSNAILPTTNTGAITSTAVDLGAPGYEYRNLYLSGNVTSTGMSTFSDITVGKDTDGQALIQMIANPTNGANTIHFGDATSGAASYDGYIQYAHDSRTMQFGVGGAEAMRILRDDGTGDGTVRIKGGLGLNYSSSSIASNYMIGVGTDNSYRAGVIFELQTSQSLWAIGFVKIKCAAGRNGLQSRIAAEYLYRFQAHDESISGIALVSSAGNTGDFTISVTEANANSSAGTVELKVKATASTDFGTSVIVAEVGHYSGINKLRRGI